MGGTATLGESGVRGIVQLATGQASYHLRKQHILSLTLERGTGSGSSSCRLTEGSVLEEEVLSSMWIL